jgi:hypothetical protein
VKGKNAKEEHDNESFVGSVVISPFFATFLFSFALFASNVFDFFVNSRGATAHG